MNAYSRRVALSALDFIPCAHVGITKQPRGAITELGEIRGFSRHMEALRRRLRCSIIAPRYWSEKSENHGNLKKGFNFKNVLNCFALIQDGFRLRADQKALGRRVTSILNGLD